MNWLTFALVLCQSNVKKGERKYRIWEMNQQNSVIAGQSELEFTAVNTRSAR